MNQNYIAPQATTDPLTKYIGWVFLFVVLASILVPILSHYFYKGHIREIEIVKLRSTKRDMLNFSRTKYNESNYAAFVHETVDFRYCGKKMLHTFNCESDVFQKLHVGMTYRVLIRYNTIIKIIQ